MGYSPNNPLVPGDPYSYDLKWMVDEINKQRAPEEEAAAAKAAAEAAKASEEAAALSEGAAALSERSAANSAEIASTSANSITNQYNYLNSKIDSEIDRSMIFDAGINSTAENLSSRMAVIESGTTPSGSEITDVRVGLDNITYPIAGDSVRANDQYIKRDVINVQSNNENIDKISQAGTTAEVINNDGTISASTTYRTTGFIPVESGEDYIITKNYDYSAQYLIIRATYDESQNFLAFAAFNSDQVRAWTIPYNVRYVRFSFRNTDFSGYITMRKSSSLLDRLKNKTFTYQQKDIETLGIAEINLSRNVAQLKPAMPIVPYEDVLGVTQGFTIYGKYLFQYLHGSSISYIRIYDIENTASIADIPITTGHHGNTLFFANYKYADADPFPILVISGDLSGDVLLVRITLTSAQIISTINFPSSTFGYCPQMCYDPETEKVFVVGSVELLDGVNNFFTDNLTITQVDGISTSIISTFDISVGQILIQGISALNDQIFVCSGGSTYANSILIITVANRSIPKIIQNIDYTSTHAELESIAFTPSAFKSSYDTIALMRASGYYQIIL